MAKTQQLSFDFTSVKTTRLRNRLFQMRRGLLAWLLGQQPTAIGMDVICRTPGQRMDLAACWSELSRSTGNSRKLLRPRRTLGIICCLDQQSCWEACVNEPELIQSLKSLRNKMTCREEDIRQNEPELREPGALFAEYATWNFADSKDLEYQTWREQATTLDQLVRKGTRLQRIMQTNMLNELYIAVPAKVINAEEIPDACGLIWIENNLTIQVVRQATPFPCTHDAQEHFVQNIALAAINQLQSIYGVHSSKKGEISFTIPPRLRHKSDKPVL